MDEQTKASRARFLGTVGAAGVAGAAIAGGAWRTSKAGAAAAPGTGGRAFSAGHFALQLEGSKEIGFLRSVEGGNAVGEVRHEVGSASYYQKKHIGNVKYEEITAEFGMAMSKDVYDWISATLTGNRDQERKSGAIIAADFNFNAQARREFTDALITEVGFPALDASSKDAAFMTVKFAPEETVDKPASGKLSPESKKLQKQWLPSNFRFEVGDKNLLPTGRVNKIEAITIKRTVVTDEIGDTRDPQKEPGKLEFPNLVFTLPEADAQPWLDYFEDFVIQGNNSDNDGGEKRGRLTYLASNLKDELGRLDFFNLGIFKISTDKAEAASDTIKRVKVELYCERLEFMYLAGAIA